MKYLTGSIAASSNEIQIAPLLWILGKSLMVSAHPVHAMHTRAANKYNAILLTGPIPRTKILGFLLEIIFIKN